MGNECKKIRRSGLMPDGSYLVDDLWISADFKPFEAIRKHMKVKNGKYEVYDDDGNLAEIYDKIEDAIGRALDEEYGCQEINCIYPS